MKYSHIIKIEPIKIKEYCLKNKLKVFKKDDMSGFVLNLEIKRPNTTSLTYQLLVYSHNENLNWWNKNTSEAIYLTCDTKKILQLFVKKLEVKFPEILRRIRIVL
jgi:hypothetical protein